MGYKIREENQIRDLSQEETKLVESTLRKIKAMNYAPNALELYQARTNRVLELAKVNTDYRNYLMNHVVIGSGDVTLEGISAGDFTKFDFQGEQSLAGFIAKQFSQHLKGGRK